jgi:hypothetical protein
MVWIVGFYNGELYAGAGRGAFEAWVFKRRYCELDVGCGYPWRGLYVLCDFLLIGASLFGRMGGGMARVFMPTWMWAATILQSLGSIFTHLYVGTFYRFWDGVRRGTTGAGDMWSLAVYKGKLFMGCNNGDRGTVLAIRVGCLSLERLIQF